MDFNRINTAKFTAKLFVSGPYYSLMDAQGHYSMDIPTGTYKVTAWHARLPSQTREIQVKEGGYNVLDFTLSVKQLPEIK